MTDRRTFLRALAASAATTSLSAQDAQTTSDKLGQRLPTRVIGKTKEAITALTIGGSHAEKCESEKVSQEIIETAIEVGIRSFDNARLYGGGNAEVVYGKLLTPKYRDHIYLTTKTLAKDGASARKELETSLRNMKTDRIDLWQIHSITSATDVDSRWNNGVIDEFLKAREEGLVRHLGFTGHRSPSAHLRMIERLRGEKFTFDTCLMPMNLVDPHYDSFIVQVLPKLIEDDYGIFAMKTLAHGNMLAAETSGHNTPTVEGIGTIADTDLTVADMHRYVYSLPICSLVSGCLKPTEVKANARILKEFKGLDNETRDQLLAQAKPFAGNTMEYYKGKPI